MAQAFRIVLLIASGMLVGQAEAQNYPIRPMRVVIPNPPGGTLDITARLIGPKMTEVTGQALIIDNRPGADTNIGTEIVARAPADGYTMLLQTVPFVVNPSIFRKLPFDVVNDFAPVSLMVSVPFVLVVNNAVPAKSVKELIALAKAQPGKLSYASAGNGSNLHVAAELFNNLTGTKMLHVQYKGGGPALVAVLGGEVSLSYLSVPAAAPHIKAGKLRGIAATGTQRTPVLPDLPTVAESGVAGYEFTTWVGVLVPRATPAATVNALNGHITKAVKSPDLTARFADQGADVIASTPAQFAAFIKSEMARWAKVVKENGIKVE
ncbi:MAG TPA: tripartite tricarboxylate transporter substrate binding protein [Burkholderiales bacterium]|nr:tripartite tricarboxylate transporter substrate binding protein [Burkholderiales bacterium]